MARAAINENNYSSGTRGYYEQRTPPLSVQGMMAERNSRIIYGDSGADSYGDYYANPHEDDYYYPAPRKAVKRNKVYRKKVSGQKGGKHAHSRIRYPYISLREKSFIILLLVVIAVVVFGVISFSAVRANIQSNINDAKANTAVIQKDIDTLNVMIEESKTISTLERRAKEEAGMKYPGTTETVYLSTTGNASEEKVAQDTKGKS